MVSGTVYHILFPILIDGSTTSPNMSRGTKSSSTAQSSFDVAHVDPERKRRVKRPPIIPSTCFQHKHRDASVGTVRAGPKRGACLSIRHRKSGPAPYKNKQSK